MSHWNGRLFGLAGALAAGLGLAAFAQQQQQQPQRKGNAATTKAAPAARAAAGNAAATEDDRLAQPILDHAARYVAAYNAHDVAAILALFTEDADVITGKGQTFVGRDELQAAFEAAFAEEPKAQVSLDITEVRFLTEDVALEEGTLTYFADGETASSVTDYTLVHVRRGGAWKTASARSISEADVTPYERLRPLEWLLGDWVDEAADSVVHFHFKWDENHSFLLQDFEVQVRGDVALRGTQRIGWDPLAKQIRSWVFDSQGGFGEAIWTPVEDRLIIKGSSVGADGSVASMTRAYERVDRDIIRWSVRDHISDGEPQPDIEATLVRRAPAPQVESN
jgi:uncharacterized protein (TIGR02246 family)